MMFILGSLESVLESGLPISVN